VHFFITGESITNKNNSRIFEEIQNRFWTGLLGPFEKLFEEKKTRDEKSRDTVPLILAP
jgi:hypothetical protein